MKESFLNILFRGLTLGSKFLLILFLGKYSIDEVNLGLYGIFSTTVVLLIYVIGFDFYVFNTREILENKKSQADKVISQLFFHFVTYIFIIPISIIFVFQFEFIPIEYLWIFILLIFSEHLGQECYRLFVTLQKSVIGNLLLFVRAGLWIWYILFDYFVLDNKIDLQWYFVVWAVFSWSSFIISFFILKYQLSISTIGFGMVNWKWIKLGIKNSLIFFIGSLSFQVIQFSDRYMIDYFYGKKLVGVYTAYAQFANSIEVFTFSAVTMLAFPKLIKASEDQSLYSKTKAKFLKDLLVITFVLVVFVILITPSIFEFLGKNLLLVEISSFYVLILAVIALIVSNVFHYDLYVKRKDKLILIIAVIAMCVNVVLNLALIPKYGVLGASLSTLISFLIILILKLYFSFKIN